MIQKILVMVAILGIVGGAAWFAFGRDPNPTKEAEHLLARYASLSTMLEDGNLTVRDGRLRQFVSESRILVASEQTSLSTALAGIGVKKVSKAVAVAEADAETTAKLGEAKINGQYDTVYPKVLEQKLDSTAALIREVNGKTSNGAVKTALAKAYDTISGIQDRLSKL